jgi:ubiquinone/menaquinone biosynthesis C-methylase UbiE
MYDAFSEDYDRFVNWESRLASEMPFIERLLQPLEKDGQPVRVLDAACGTGITRSSWRSVDTRQRGRT